jgi:cytochrome d ubiquinol oxidase subunit II
MDLPLALMAVLWVGLTAYVLLGGADFGGGVWDLLAGGSVTGRARRARVEHSIGPVWEANHVWLIFVLVLMWTGIPRVYAAVMSTLYIPLTLAALGIIARGSAFAFRKVSPRLPQQRLFGAAFALASLLTPFFLGTAAGGIAAGRVPPGLGEGDILTSWVNPTSLMTGLLSVVTVAYLAAVYLTRDAERSGEHDLAEYFRHRALAAGAATGAASAAGLVVLRLDRRSLFDELTSGWALACVVLSIVMGVVSLVLLWRRLFLAVRITAALAVVGLLWGWGVGQYPILLPGLDLHGAAATDSVLAALLGALAVGALLLLPSMAWLFSIFQRREPVSGAAERR